jgi:MFS family permease
VSPPSGNLPRAWLVVALLWVVAALNYLDRIMITTMRDSLTGAIPMTEAQFGMLTSVFLWVYGLLSPFAGFLADRFNRGRLIIASLFVWSALTWLTGHVRSFEQLIVVRSLMGVSEAAYLPAALALIADYHRGSTRSLATGIHMTGLSVGSGLGGVGGWMAERHGWAFAFDVFGVIGLAYAMVLLVLLREAPGAGGPGTAVAPKVRLGQAFASLLGNGSFLLLLAYWSLFGLAGWAVTGWMPTYFKEHFHLEQGAAGISATSYLAAGMLFGKLIGGAWADRWSRTDPRARILVPGIGMFIAAPAIFLVANTDTLALAIAGLSLYGMMRSFSDANLMPILCQVSDARYRATGYGILNLFACTVGGLTIYAGGVMRDASASVRTLFQGAAAGLLICGGLMMLVKRGKAGAADDVSVS